MAGPAQEVLQTLTGVLGHGLFQTILVGNLLLVKVTLEETAEMTKQEENVVVAEAEPVQRVGADTVLSVTAEMG
jgi:hypothetical protein